MKLLWEHPLPTDEKSFDALYEGPSMSRESCSTSLPVTGD